MLHADEKLAFADPIETPPVAARLLGDDIEKNAAFEELGQRFFEFRIVFLECPEQQTVEPAEREGDIVEPEGPLRVQQISRLGHGGCRVSFLAV